MTANIRGHRACLAGASREMRRRTGKSARHASTGHALRPAQRQADDRRNRRLKTMLVQGRFVFRRSSCVAAALPGPCSALCTTVPPNRSDTSVCALGHNRRTRRLPVLRRMAVCRGGHARCRGDRQSRRAASGSVLGLLRSEPDVGLVKGRVPRRAAAGSMRSSQGAAAVAADRDAARILRNPTPLDRIALTLGQAACPVRVDRTRGTVPENGRPGASLNHAQGHRS